MRSVNALAAETHAFTPACIRMSSPHASISKKNSRHQPRGPQEPHNRRHPAPPKPRTGAQAPPRTAATPPAARSRTLAPSAGAHAPRGLLHAAAACRRRASPRRRRSHTSSHRSGVARGTHALRRLAMPAAPSAPPPPARSLARAKGDVLAPLCHRRAPAAGSAARRKRGCHGEDARLAGIPACSSPCRARLPSAPGVLPTKSLRCPLLPPRARRKSWHTNAVHELAG